MSVFDDNLKALRTLKPPFTNKRLGYIGRYNADGTADSDPRSGLSDEYVWVRFGEDRGATRIKNLRVRAAWGLPVWVEFNELTREDEITGVHSLLAPEVVGGALAAALNAPSVPASVSTPTAAQDVVPGGIFADAGGGRAVRIAATWTPFGTWWDGTSTITLTPTATANHKAFVLIGIQSDGTYTTSLTADRALALTLLTAERLPTAAGATDIKTVTDANADVWWVGGVELANGATSIDSTRIVDRRFWTLPVFTGATGSVAGVTGLVPAPSATDDVKALFGNGTYQSVVKADGTVAMAAALNLNGYDLNAVNWLNFDDSTELTIASGAVTAAQTFHRIDTESDAASDDLDTVSGGSDGRLLIIRADNAARTVVVKHNTGNIQLFGAADVSLDETYKAMLLIYDGTLSKWVQVGGSGSGGGGGGTITGDVLPSTCEGRLTLTSATPVTTSDVTAATTLYFTPYKGNVVALYDGVSAWTGYTFTERSLSLTGLLATTVYDIFLYDNAGTLTLEATAWTNSTTRATALTLQNGVEVKSGATARRYLGTIYIETAGQCDDSVGRRHVWNRWQQVMRRMLADPSDSSHTYNSSTLREWNGGSTPGNTRVSVVVGLNEHCVRAQMNSAAEGNGTGYGLSINIGLDSSSTGAAITMNVNSPSNNNRTFIGVSYNNYVGIGAHTLRMLQASGTATTTWHGQFSSMTAEIMM